MESIALAAGYDYFVVSICKQCRKMYINSSLIIIYSYITFYSTSLFTLALIFLIVHSATKILTLAMQTAFLKIFLQHYLLFCASVWPDLEHIRFFAR